MGDGERDPVDGDRALLDDVCRQAGWEREVDRLPTVPGRARRDGGGAVDVALDDVAAEPAVGGHRALEVDAVARSERAQAAAGERLGHDVDREAGRVVLGHGEADAVDGDGGAVRRVADDEGSVDAQHGRVGAVLDRRDGAQLLDDSGEHVSPQGSGVLTSRWRVWLPGSDGRDGVDADVSPDDGDVDEVEAADVRDGPDAEVRDGGVAGAEQGRRDVGVDVVDETGGEEGRGQRRAALEPHVADSPAPQQVQGLPRVSRREVDERPGRVADPRALGTSRSPITARRGCRGAGSPPGIRTVRRGSSARTVPVPTRTASRVARSRWTSARAASPVIHWLVPSAAALRPSRVVASFHVTRGRPSATVRAQRSLIAAASSASTPPVTWTPAACSRSAPPEASGLGPTGRTRRGRPRTRPGRRSTDRCARCASTARA